MFSESTLVLENIKLLLENMKELHGIAEIQRLLDVNGLGDRSVVFELELLINWITWVNFRVSVDH